MESEYKYMVYVSCMTYNHAPYIKDALNGICMQQTNFPFVCGLIDDCSTDGEQEVLRQYMSENFNLDDTDTVRREETDDYYLTFARHKNNQNCYFAFLLLKYNHRQAGRKPKLQYMAEWRDNSKYHAICEGDDYWIVSSKLQKQVVFLEENHDYSMCFHNAIIKYEEKADGIVMDAKVESRDYSGKELFKNWVVPTGSMVYNRTEVDSVKNKGNYRPLFNDIVTVLKCAEKGKVRGFSDEMSVYRVHSSSMVHNKTIIRENVFRKVDHYKFIKENFGVLIGKRTVNTQLSHAYFEMFRAMKGGALKGLCYLFMSILYDPRVMFIRIKDYYCR